MVFPAERYQGTNFGSAGMGVRIVDAKTPKACSVVDEGTQANIRRPAKEAERVINGVRFSHSTAGGAAMSHYSELNVYRGFVKSKCYELSINVTFQTSRCMNLAPSKNLPRVTEREF